MSGNSLTSKIADPYVRALFDLSVEKNIMHQITSDFLNLDTFLNAAPELVEYINNPTLNQKVKRVFVTKTFKYTSNTETFNFIMVLLERNRINLLTTIIKSYLKLIYQTASIKIIEVSTASAFTNLQKDTLIQKLKKLTNAREIQLEIDIDTSLIGGFLIKTESKIIDFTVKNQLQKLAKHLDTVLKI